LAARQLARAARGSLADLRAYLASYLLVGVAWLNHADAFRHIRRMDRGLQWSNLAVLFTTGLLPFPTAVLYLGGGLLGVTVSPLLALAIFIGLPIFYALTSEGLPAWRDGSSSA
jgi:uncharacterized membrane protein